MPKLVDHDERKREIVDAAWRIIARKGIDEVTTREIAREAGYSHGVLAHYFETKDEILLAAQRRSHERIDARYQEETTGVEAIDALRAILHDNLPEDNQRALETRIEMSFWERALNNPNIAEVQSREADKLQALLGKLIDDARQDGHFGHEADTADAVALLAAAIDGLSLHVLLYPDRVSGARCAVLMDMLLSMIQKLSTTIRDDP